MNNLRTKNHTFRIKIHGFPIKQIPTKPNWHSYISFVTGSMLFMSESMPFVDNNYNGILHALIKVRDEYKNDFK